MIPDEPVISVVVPVFNEIGDLPRLREAILEALDSIGRPFEIVLVDDGSTDGSSALLDEYRRDHEAIRVVRLDRNWGLTSALDAGFRAARGSIIATLDADLQNDPKDIATLLDHLDGFDLVCGWRKERCDPWVKRASSKVANAIRNRFSQDIVHDTCCPLKVMRREVIESIRLFDGLHRFIPTLARSEGFRVTEVPVRHYRREHGSSKYGVWNRIFKGLSDLRTIRWMKRNRLRYTSEIRD